MSQELDDAGQLLDDLNGAGAPKISDARRFAMLEQIVWHHHRYLRATQPTPPPAVATEPNDEGRLQYARLVTALEGTVGFPVQLSFLGHQAAALRTELQRRASADAATIAGLRRVVDAAVEAAAFFKRVRGDELSGVVSLTAYESKLVAAVDALPASLRPQPGGGK